MVPNGRFFSIPIDLNSKHFQPNRLNVLKSRINCFIVRQEKINTVKQELLKGYEETTFFAVRTHFE